MEVFIMSEILFSSIPNYLHVKKGDVIVKLSNSSLDLQILSAESELAEKQNLLRNTQISMEQDRLNNKNEKLQLDMDIVRKRRTYQQQTKLYKEQLNSREEYIQAKEDYDLAVKKHSLIVRRLSQDSLYRRTQVSQMSENLDNMRKNVLLVRQRKEHLNIRSMATMRKFKQIDGSNNWVGNDRYIGFIRLAKGCKIEDIHRSVEKMRQENLPLKKIKQAGTDLNYMFTPLNKIHTSDPAVKKMSWILSLLAFILIFSAVMNYLLIVIGNIVGRAKEMAVRKCYGAKGNNIHSIIFSETLVHLIISIALAACLIIACRGMTNKFVTNFFGFSIVIGIVITIGHRQSALGNVYLILATVFIVLCYSEVKESRIGNAVYKSRLIKNFVLIFYIINLIQIFF